MPPGRALTQRTRSSGYGFSGEWGLMHRKFKLFRVVADSFVVPTGVDRA